MRERVRCVRGCRQAAGNTASESRISASQTIKTTRRIVSAAADDDSVSATRSATQHWHWFSHCSYTSFACSFFALSSLLLFLLLPRLSLVTCRTGCAGISHTHTHIHATHTCTNKKRHWERETGTLTFKYGSKARSLHVLAPHFLIAFVCLAFQNTNTYTHVHSHTHTHTLTSTPIQRGTWKQSLNLVCFYLLLLLYKRFSLSFILFGLLRNYIGNHLATFN